MSFSSYTPSSNPTTTSLSTSQASPRPPTAPTSSDVIVLPSSQSSTKTTSSITPSIGAVSSPKQASISTTTLPFTQLASAEAPIHASTRSQASVGAVMGAIWGGLALICLVGLAIFYLKRRQRRRQALEESYFPDQWSSPVGADPGTSERSPKRLSPSTPHPVSPNESFGTATLPYNQPEPASASPPTAAASSSPPTAATSSTGTRETDQIILGFLERFAPGPEVAALVRSLRSNEPGSSGDIMETDREVLTAPPAYDFTRGGNEFIGSFASP